jgi:hypothetical protein
LNPARGCALEVEGHSTSINKAGTLGGKEGAFMHSNERAMTNSDGNVRLIHNLKYVSLLATLVGLFLICAGRA